MREAVTKLTASDCPLCNADGGLVLWRDDFCRVVLVADEDYPGFCRVILTRHVSEMTTLDREGRDRLMNVVFATESVLRESMSPHKINLASLGNMVPHIHWHVIPRFSDDRHFPDSVWAAPRRADAGRAGVPDPEQLSALLRRQLG
jgi:diadenosine tetraphosphate (Ap4A) HIT family hydrolase